MRLFFHEGEGAMAKVFVMPDEDFDTTTKEGQKQQRQAVTEAARRYNFWLVPAGGAKGGIGKGRYVHNDRIHNIK